MPHVTHFKIKAKPGERQAVIDAFKRFQDQRAPNVTGFMRSILTSNINDPDQFMAAAMFDTKENYDANSNDSAQGAWYQDLRSHLVADPEWFNGNLELQFNA